MCLEVDSMIMTLQQFVIRGYKMDDPYAEAMVHISKNGLINFCSFNELDCEFLIF